MTATSPQQPDQATLLFTISSDEPYTSVMFGVYDGENPNGQLVSSIGPGPFRVTIGSEQNVQIAALRFFNGHPQIVATGRATHAELLAGRKITLVEGNPSDHQ